MKSDKLIKIKDPHQIERLILLILAKKKRPMNSKQITEELRNYGLKISRPTVATYLRNLYKNRKIKEI